MKIRVKDIQSNILMMITLFVFICITFFASMGTAGIIIAFLVFILVCILILAELSSNYELSIVLSIPIMLSVFQNVYLGLFSPQLPSAIIQMLTVLNFLLACIIFGYLFINDKKRDGKRRKFENLMVTLIVYSIISIIFLEKYNILSIISSFRNIISIFLFFFIGFLGNKKLELRKFENIILFIGLVVIFVGIYDVFANGTLWKNLNITDLWTKKGIRVQPSGLPTNFYSSETINGERIRRMASTFADPVHLGAFLFAVYCIAWHRNKKIIAALMIIGTVMTVSKGAWLGLLIFICVYAYYSFPKSVFLCFMGFSGLVGVAFLIYAFRTSANSVFLHISGLVAAFKGLAKNPFGSGIGSNGVLAKQFSGFSINENVTETGLGMVMVQLGIVGLVIYVSYFIYLIKLCRCITDKRDAIFSLSLLLSIIANIFFNEVALSPNTCAVYFIIIGYIAVANINDRTILNQDFSK